MLSLYVISRAGVGRDDKKASRHFGCRNPHPPVANIEPADDGVGMAVGGHTHEVSRKRNVVVGGDSAG
jgi:hypothetical protein